MADKTTKYLKSWISDLRDVRSLGFLVFASIALLVTWSTVGSIQANYDLQKKVARFEQQNDVSVLENTNLRLKNEYYNTDQYLELTARKQFGKAAPGETVYIVPTDVALKYVTAPAPTSQQVAATEINAVPGYEKNLKAWRQFLFRTGN